LGKNGEPVEQLRCIQEGNVRDGDLSGLYSQSVMIVGDVLRFGHQSFADFLTDSVQCPKVFLIDLVTLALASLKAMGRL
jgi:hypothetical protein